MQKGLAGEILVAISHRTNWVVKLASWLQQAPNFDAVDAWGVDKGLEIVVAVFGCQGGV